jgi:vesicular inhibitory amino acid transporter
MDFDRTKAHLKAQAREKLKPLEKAQKEQERKAKEAAEYRKKILTQQKATSADMSPGFRKEVATSRRAQKYKAESSEKPPPDGKTTFSQCVFNLANILMGVGLLGLPYSCAKAGFLGGTFALILFGFICWRTAILIGRELNGDPRPQSYFVDSPWKTPLPPGSDPRARMRKPIRSFPDIAREAFGHTGALLLSVVLYFELFSCVAIFIVSIGDHLHELFPQVSVSTHMLWVCFFSAVPVIVLRSVRLLSYLSLLGTVATICVVVAVVFAASLEGDLTDYIATKNADSVREPPYHDAWREQGLPIAFGLVAYCFSGHAIIPSIYNSMEKPYQYEKMVDVTFIIVMICCMAVGLSGYIMFGDFVADQVTLSLNQFSSASLVMTILTYLMILTAFSKLTLTMFPLSLGFEEIVAPFLSSDAAMFWFGVVIKMILLFGALAVAVFVPSFSLLCSLVGMICTMTVSVIFPAGAYLTLFWPRLSLLERIFNLVFVFAGIAMAVIGTALGLS